VLILASASPRRADLLRAIGLSFEVVPSDVDEHPRAGEEPPALAERLARTKAEVGAQLRPGRWVLGADTVVALGSRILGKPEDAADARAMLEALSGRTHRVWTAYCLVGPGAAIARAVVTDVQVRALSPREIDAYLACGEWRGKAGAYAIQGVFAYAIPRIEGSYTNVVGLPLAEVVEDLERAGALAAFPEHGFPT
jgi:septum formation protein